MKAEQFNYAEFVDKVIDTYKLSEISKPRIVKNNIRSWFPDRNPADLINWLVKEDIINDSGHDTYKLTQKGCAIDKAGGWLKYQEWITFIEKEKEAVKKLEIEKLKYDVKNAKRIYKSYWWTFAFAIIALVISIFTFIRSLS